AEAAPAAVPPLSTEAPGTLRPRPAALAPLIVSTPSWAELARPNCGWPLSGVVAPTVVVIGTPVVVVGRPVSGVVGSGGAGGIAAALGSTAGGGPWTAPITKFTTSSAVFAKLSFTEMSCAFTWNTTVWICELYMAAFATKAAVPTWAPYIHGASVTRPLLTST